MEPTDGHAEKEGQASLPEPLKQREKQTTQVLAPAGQRGSGEAGEFFCQAFCSGSQVGLVVQRWVPARDSQSA